MGRISMPTLSCPEEPPCTPVLPTECRRRLPLLPHPPSRSRSLLHQRESTPSGSEDPSCFPLHLPADVDLQAGIRRVRPSHCPPQVLLNILLSSVFVILHNQMKHSI